MHISVITGRLWNTWGWWGRGYGWARTVSCKGFQHQVSTTTTAQSHNSPSYIYHLNNTYQHNQDLLQKSISSMQQNIMVQIIGTRHLGMENLWILHRRNNILLRLLRLCIILCMGFVYPLLLLLARCRWMLSIRGYVPEATGITSCTCISVIYMTRATTTNECT